MMEGSSYMKKRTVFIDEFIDLVFSWSIQDIFDETLYEYQVKNIPESFESVDHYLGSFSVPLLEETRASLAASLEVIDKAPFGELISFYEVKPYGSLFFDVKVDYWRNVCGDGREPYRTLPGDIVVISDAKPETASDLQRAAVAKDANNQTLPIAWAIVEYENKNTWTWFLKLLIGDLGMGDGRTTACDIDMQKGLQSAMKELLPPVEHGMCARHIPNRSKEWRGLQRRNQLSVQKAPLKER
ncbi:uncharacterized protein LOC132032038 [Lycium ferocissimum]|uniref:uncharacterized protein LOC132032038 n=1 Tax=Lycium ferocissimum TaxID=112874 RepID=UPI0028164511|nr:uncharacterized protein LOC132032038 [Lycium ferocissimum]